MDSPQKAPELPNKMKRQTTSVIRLSLLLALLLTHAEVTQADGMVIDKIYHPYVQPLEQELEFRTTLQDNQPGRDDNLQSYHFAYGRSFNDRWFGEIYLIGERSDDESFKIEAYELEALWQLTEQGEFSADWGLLFELEKVKDLNIWEFSTGLLAEKEWGQWSTTANYIVTYEWGHDIDNEVESKLGLQARYRYSSAIEPGIEFYAGEDTRALGPVLLGQIKLGGKRKLKWELGAVFGLEHDSPNRTLRLLTEFEF